MPNVTMRFAIRRFSSSGTRMAVVLLLFAIAAGGCGRADNALEKKLAQIAVWEDQGWDGNGQMLTLLSDDHEAVRVRAALALGRINDTLNLDTLRSVLLNDQSPEVRGMAAFAMGAWIFRNGKDALLEAVRTETDPDALINILHGLARTYARDEWLTYVHLLHHPDPRVRAQTALALDLCNQRDAADSILPLLDDPATRWLAAFSLARMRSARAAEWGFAHCDDPDPVMRKRAYSLAGSMQTPEGALKMVEGMQDPDARVRAGAAETMLLTRDSVGAQHMVPLLAGETNAPVLQKMVKTAGLHWQMWAQPYYSELLDHPDHSVRAEAVNALCKRPDLACADFIIPAADDPHPRVRLAVMQTVEELIRLGSRDTTLLPTVRRLTSDPSPMVRAYAVQAYAAYGPPDLFEYLNRLFNDDDLKCVSTAVNLIGSAYIHAYTDSLRPLYRKHRDDARPEVKWAIAAAGTNLLPTVQIDSIRQDILNWGMADPDRLVRWYTIAVARKFRQELGSGMGTFQTDLTVENVEELLHPYPASPRAILHTTRGDITVAFLDEWAPRTVRRFIEIARSGHYDNTPINDVQADQAVHAGDRRGDGFGTPDPAVRDEYSPLRIEEGSIFWSSNTRDAGRGIFGIALSRLPYMDWRFAIFGTVTDGLDIARQLTVEDTIRTITIEIPQDET